MIISTRIRTYMTLQQNIIQTSLYVNISQWEYEKCCHPPSPLPSRKWKRNKFLMSGRSDCFFLCCCSRLIWGMGLLGSIIPLLVPRNLVRWGRVMGGQRMMTPWHRPATMGLLPDTPNCGLRMRRECRERFPRHHGLAIPTCITARALRTCRDACRDR